MPRRTLLGVAYDRQDIDKVRASVNLLDLVGAVTTVKKQGRSFKAVCPFHQEKTASLSLDPARGLYHCFGCQAEGDVFSWVRQTQGLDFTEAVEYLARLTGITLRVDKDAARRRGERENLVEAVEAAVAFYHQRLKLGPDGGDARSYLRGRGYDASVVDRYQIGYAPRVDSWDALVAHLRSAGVKEKTMLDAGLASRGRTGRLRDTFYGRIVFPIYDLRGDPVGFGGRKLDGEGPKYLNSPESRLYQKAKLLYGLNWAKGSISRSSRAIIVEGYTDVIAMHRAGFDEAVATCGTALGEDHFDLLRRFAEQVVLAFDADQAGAGAALRGDELETPVRLDLDLRVAIMPEGKDPADLVAAGDEEVVRQAVEQSEPLLRFRLDRELLRYNLDEPEARAKALHRTTALVARVSDELTRHEYARHLARKTGVEFAVVSAAVEKAVKPAARTVAAVKDKTAGSRLFERELLRVVIANPVELPEDVGPALFAEVDYRRAMEILLPVFQATAPGEPLPLGSLDDEEIGPVVRRLAMEERDLPDAVEVYNRVRQVRIEEQIKELDTLVLRLDPAGEEYSLTLRRLIALQQDRRRLGVER